MKTHTPGPWQIEKTSDHSASYRVMDEQEATVALCYQQPFRNEWSAKANARLLAAAPELLEVLRRGADTVSALEADLDEAGFDCYPARHWWQDADRIIAKATGSHK